MQSLKFLFTACSIVILSACMANDPGQNGQNGQNNNFPDVEQSANQANNTLTNTDIANHLAEIAAQVPDVKGANAVVAGPYAVVAIDIDKDTKRQRVGTIKYSVSEALRDDRYGKTAVVVADADVVQRIREMQQKMEEGHVIHGVVDELAEIVARYMPTFPVEDDPPVEQEENQLEPYPQDMEEVLPNE